MRPPATRVAVASSAKHVAEDNRSICEKVPLSKQTTVSEHLKAVQAKQLAQQQSYSIVESDEESGEHIQSSEMWKIQNWLLLQHSTLPLIMVMTSYLPN